MEIKDARIEFTIKWELLEHAATFLPGDKYYESCVAEKTQIILASLKNPNQKEANTNNETVNTEELLDEESTNINETSNHQDIDDNPNSAGTDGNILTDVNNSSDSLEGNVIHSTITTDTSTETCVVNFTSSAKSSCPTVLRNVFVLDVTCRSRCRAARSPCVGSVPDTCLLLSHASSNGVKSSSTSGSGLFGQCSTNGCVLLCDGVSFLKSPVVLSRGDSSSSGSFHTS